MITFYEPIASPYNATVTLRNPQLGDANQVDVKSSIKQTMDGDLYTHKRTPSNNKLLLTFTALHRDAKDEFITFYNSSIGKQLKYIDHDSTVWIGYIVSESLQVTTHRDNCDYGITLEFKGAKQ